jgi:hypothetical protein
MALSILDGNQSATTLSTILSSGQHITAHTVISLGTQAITDIVNATSANLTNTQLRASAVTVGGTVTVGNSLTISSLPVISGTVTANAIGRVIDGTGNFLQIPIIPYDQDITSASDQYAVPVQISTLNGSVGSSTPLPISGTVTIGSALPAGTNRIGVVTIGAGTVTIGAGTAQIGTVTVGNISSLPDAGGNAVVRNFMFGYDYVEEVPVAIASNGTALAVVVANAVSANLISALPAGTNRIGVVTIGAGTVTIGAGTAQIGSVTASISGTVPISISSVTVGNSVTIGSLPAISGTVTVNLSISSTAITSGSFTSLTSATLVPANTARKMATVYNLGAGQLFVNAGVTATTIGGGFMVALSSGDFYECDYTTTTLSAIFATAGTASWVSH